MSHPPLSRLAGPTALAAGVLMVVAQLVMFPFDLKDHVATSTDPRFQAGGAAYFVGFALLLLALVAAHTWQESRAAYLSRSWLEGSRGTPPCCRPSASRSAWPSRPWVSGCS